MAERREKWRVHNRLQQKTFPFHIEDNCTYLADLTPPLECETEVCRGLERRLLGAIAAYEQLVAHYPGSAIAEDAAWKISQFDIRQEKWDEAIKAFNQFMYNFPRSARVEDAQFAVAECYEHLGDWVKAMDAYQTYLNKFPEGKNAQKARDQINWIKAYHL